MQFFNVRKLHGNNIRAVSEAGHWPRGPEAVKAGPRAYGVLTFGWCGNGPAVVVI